MISRRIDFVTGLFNEAMALRSERDRTLNMFALKCLENDSLRNESANKDFQIEELRAEIERLRTQGK